MVSTIMAHIMATLTKLTTFDVWIASLNNYCHIYCSFGAEFHVFCAKNMDTVISGQIIGFKWGQNIHIISTIFY